jgi:hypothetical protein
MKNYATLTEALDDLRRRGYTEDFNLKPTSLECAAKQVELHPNDFEITEVYRFEGATNPDDSSVLYAIAGKDGLKGVLVDAYGMYATSVSTDMLAKLSIRH